RVWITPLCLYLNHHAFFARNAFRFLIPASLLYIIVLLRSSVATHFALMTELYLLGVAEYVGY
ncbi:MAG: hypothetical protein OSB13_04335, partial [Porticoccaceae bacterium]|nr:hypothetical protein [Porticoccaceae bacterium]